MIISAEQFTIRLRRPFRIAHATSLTRRSILVRVRDNLAGLEGRGEGALPPYYPSEAQACLSWVGQLVAPSCEDSLEAQIRKLPWPPAEASAARVALDIALHDLWAQRQQQPLWRWWRLNPRQIPPCTRTISIASNEAELREMLAEGNAAGGRHFKLKAGSGDLAWDEHCIRLARSEYPKASLSVDANAAWTPQDAARMISCLADQRIDFFEQPVGREFDAWHALRDMLPTRGVPPLVADESLQSAQDLASLRALADGVNIKLLKAGGLSGARQWVTLARNYGFRILIGVMVETGIGRTAAAQLAPLADWLDIDPPDAIPVQPCAGFDVAGDQLILSEKPGLGLVSA